ncbi:MAG: DUF2314 domain-containing protein [Planctomycetota bacterium]
MTNSWKFYDAPDTACFTTTFVLQGTPILRVYHDYDGDWQFHGAADQPADPSVIKLVAMHQVVRLDPSLESLSDLPYGWAAKRSSVDAQWIRFKHTPFPSYAEDGYYLEDAVWLAQYLSDLSPPSDEACEALEVGDLVKLIFRFAAEESKREDGQCERMWVEIISFDEDGYFIGTLENDPHHSSAKYKDNVSFHPLHIAEIYSESGS